MDQLIISGCPTARSYFLNCDRAAAAAEPADANSASSRAADARPCVGRHGKQRQTAQRRWRRVPQAAMPFARSAASLRPSHRVIRSERPLVALPARYSHPGEVNPGFTRMVGRFIRPLKRLRPSHCQQEKNSQLTDSSRILARSVLRVVILGRSRSEATVARRTLDPFPELAAIGRGAGTE